jgi:hypothetical protein
MLSVVVVSRCVWFLRLADILLKPIAVRYLSTDLLYNGFLKTADDEIRDKRTSFLFQYFVGDVGTAGIRGLCRLDHNNLGQDLS